MEVLGYLADGVEPDADDRVAGVFSQNNLVPLEETEVVAAIRERLERLSGGMFETPAKKCRYLIGQVMRDLVGRVGGRMLARLAHLELGLPFEERAGVEG